MQLWHAFPHSWYFVGITNGQWSLSFLKDPFHLPQVMYDTHCNQWTYWQYTSQGCNTCFWHDSPFSSEFKGLCLTLWSPWFFPLLGHNSSQNCNGSNISLHTHTSYSHCTMDISCTSLMCLHYWQQHFLCPPGWILVLAWHSSMWTPPSGKCPLQKDWYTLSVWGCVLCYSHRSCYFLQDLQFLLPFLHFDQVQ